MHCRYMVYAWGPKGFPHDHSRANIHNIGLNGAFGANYVETGIILDTRMPHQGRGTFRVQGIYTLNNRNLRI